MLLSFRVSKVLSVTRSQSHHLAVTRFSLAKANMCCGPRRSVLPIDHESKPKICFSFHSQNATALFSPGLEPGTFRVLGERDDHYTTRTRRQPMSGHHRNSRERTRQAIFCYLFKFIDFFLFYTMLL